MEERIICELVKKRLGLDEEVIVSLDKEFSTCSKEEQERHFEFTYPDGFVTGAYSDNKFYYQKSRDCEKGRLEFLHKRYLEKCAKYRNYKEFKYFADAGSLAIGSKDFKINIHNGYGDGSFVCRVYDEDIDLQSFRGWEFYTTIDGQCYLFGYDCLDAAERKEAIENNKAFELYGRYAIYTRGVDDEHKAGIAFVKW